MPCESNIWIATLSKVLRFKKIMLKSHCYCFHSHRGLMKKRWEPRAALSELLCRAEHRQMHFRTTSHLTHAVVWVLFFLFLYHFFFVDKTRMKDYIHKPCKLNNLEKRLLRWNLPSSCCYGYLQQVAQWEWLCHQQRIREAQLGEALTPECNGTAESDKGGGTEEKWWDTFSAKRCPRACPPNAGTQACTRSHTPGCFNPQFFLLCPTKTKNQFPAYPLGYGPSPFSELLCFMPSALCSYGIVQGLWKTLCRVNWCLLRDFSNPWENLRF